MVFVEERNVIGKKIRNIRQEKKITQDQLAARLFIQGIEIDQPMIARIENQTRFLLDYEIIGIAKALGVNIEDLFKSS